jgi:hypothetical protein
VKRSCEALHGTGHHFACEVADSIDPQPDVYPIVPDDVRPLDQQRHDACLLGGEELVPQRIQSVQARGWPSIDAQACARTCAKKKPFNPSASTSICANSCKCANSVIALLHVFGRERA